LVESEAADATAARPKPRARLLAVASSGGHWAQLRRVTGALASHEIVYVTVDPAYRGEVPAHRVHIVPDANQKDPIGCLRLALRMLKVVLAERPDAVLSTGAAPGLFALLFGRAMGARTIWLDSIANAEELSLSGRLARPLAGLWLTQWPELARPGGPEFAGRVL